MSALQPRAIPLELGDIHLKLICTISAADMMEEEFGVKISEMADIFAEPDNLPRILHILDIYHTETEVIAQSLNKSNIVDAMGAAVKCFIDSLPKEDELPQQESGGKSDSDDEFSIVRIVYIGMTVLHLTYSEILNMTIRQLMYIYSERIRIKNPTQTLDDMFPL